MCVINIVEKKQENGKDSKGLNKANRNNIN